MQQRLKKTGYRVAVVLAIAGVLTGYVPRGLAAQTLNPAPSAKVSFTFDDGLLSTLTQAQPVLAQYGLTGTVYAISGCVGMTTAPNTCRANNDTPYMTWDQLRQL